MHLSYEIDKHDSNLVWRHYRYTYVNDHYGNVGKYWLRFFGIIIFMVIVTSMYVYVFPLGRNLQEGRLGFGSIVFVCMMAVVATCPFWKKAIDYQSQKGRFLDRYQVPIDAVVSNDGISVKRGAEDIHDIAWKDILSYQWYKHLLFIEYGEYYNYLVIPESTFASEEQKEYLWCLLEENVEEA